MKSPSLSDPTKSAWDVLKESQGVNRPQTPSWIRRTQSKPQAQPKPKRHPNPHSTTNQNKAPASDLNEAEAIFYYQEPQNLSSRLLLPSGAVMGYSPYRVCLPVVVTTFMSVTTLNAATALASAAAIASASKANE